jgi:hypothetical protein
MPPPLPVAADDRLVPRPGVESRAVDGGTLIVDLDTGACWELNAVGAEVWTRLAAGATVADASRALAGRYEVAREELERDVRNLCDALLAAGLLARAAPQQPVHPAP